MPATLNKTSILPYRAMTSSTQLRMEERSATSSRWALALPPAAVISDSRAWHLERVRPHSATSAPAKASPRLMAAPMPPAAPVTRAVLPSREKTDLRYAP